MDAIFHRTSVRKFENRPVPRQMIERILRAGMQAASAVNQKPWEFYVTEDREKIERLSKASKYSGCCAGAPVVIVACKRVGPMPCPDLADYDMGLCIGNMWLEADSLGLGGVWLALAHDKEREEAARAVLGIRADLEPVCLFPVGWPGESHPQEDRWEPRRIHWDD